MAEEILQGTTPSLEITINTDDFLVSEVVKLELTIKHNGITIYGLEDVVVNTDNNSFIYTFTEEETLAMTPSKQIRYQLRFKLNNGRIVGTSQMTLGVADLMSKDVMTA